MFGVQCFTWELDV